MAKVAKVKGVYTRLSVPLAEIFKLSTIQGSWLVAEARGFRIVSPVANDDVVGPRRARLLGSANSVYSFKRPKIGVGLNFQLHLGME